MRLRRFLLFSLLAVVLGASVAGGGYWAYWNFYARWQPVTIVKDQAEIQKLLESAGAVSPQRTGPWLYMITYRACAPCARYQREEFPKLAEANVDTRVIVYARPDREGVSMSTPAERSTVAEMWINPDRSWNLYLQWMAVPRREWGAPGVKPSDGDIARTAVVDASRQFIEKLTPLLKGNGLGTEYPLLIWRDRDGYLKACACADRRSYAFVRHDLGVADETPSLIALPKPEPLPEPAPAPEIAPPPAAPANRPAPRDPLATPSQPIPYDGKQRPAPKGDGQPVPGSQPQKPSDSSEIFY